PAHRIRVGRVSEGARRVGEAAQRFGCFGSITERVIKSGHESERLSQRTVSDGRQTGAPPPPRAFAGGTGVHLKGVRRGARAGGLRGRRLGLVARQRDGAPTMLGSPTALLRG